MHAAAHISPPAWMAAPGMTRVLAALQQDGEAARFVGGCVRDIVLGRIAKDVDLATPLPPDVVMARLADNGIKAIGTGLDHGTVTAVLDDPAYDHVEITTLREDVETYGRHARVAFTDNWADDAARRDFTINAMFCDPDGTVYDPVGGLDDLADWRVRFVGDPRARIREDALRLLRFFRFQAAYGKAAMAPEAIAACRELAPLVDGLSGERVAGEMLKLLAAPAPAAVLSMMVAEGILGHVVAARPFVDRLAALTDIDGDDPDPVRRLAAAFEVTAAEMEAMAGRLRLSRAQTRRLLGLVDDGHWPTPNWPEVDLRGLLYRRGREVFCDVLLVAWADAIARGTVADRAGWDAALGLAKEWPLPRLPVNGDDAVAAGVATGPAVGEVLAAVEKWWIAGGLTADRAACLAALDDVVATRRAPARR